jgi:hypothetical protein
MHPGAYPNRLGLAPDPPRPPQLHLHHGRWTASCAGCGYQLASSRSQARAQRRGRRRACPTCQEDPR